MEMMFQKIMHIVRFPRSEAIRFCILSEGTASFARKKQWKIFLVQNEQVTFFTFLKSGYWNYLSEFCWDCLHLIMRFIAYPNLSIVGGQACQIKFMRTLGVRNMIGSNLMDTAVKLYEVIKWASTRSFYRLQENQRHVRFTSHNMLTRDVHFKHLQY